MGTIGFGIIQEIIRRRDAQRELDKSLSGPIGSITSRDQIIDPYALVDPNNYAKTRKGIASYEADLASAERYAEQQEAAYKEWYESPEQQVARDRQAGLNSDLVGASTSEAADVEPSSRNPLEGISTNGQVFSNFFASAINTLSAISGLSSAFSSVSLNKSIQEGQDLGNRDALKRILASDISDSLGSALQSALSLGEEFDLEGWFSNDENFSKLRDSYGSYSSFDSALSLAREQSLRHYSSAVELQKNAAQGTWDLANIVSDPRYSPSQVLTMIHLQPYTEAVVEQRAALIELEKVIAEYNKDVYNAKNPTIEGVSATLGQIADAAESQYSADYYDQLDGKLFAAFEQYIQKCSLAGHTMSSKVNSHYLDMFTKDPSGEDAWKAAYLFGSNGGRTLEEAYYLQSIEDYVSLMSVLLEQSQVDLTNSKWDRWLELADLGQKYITAFKSGNSKTNPLQFIKLIQMFGGNK